MLGSLMRPKFTGLAPALPPYHHTYCVSGSPPGWLRHVMAWNLPPIAVLMSWACSWDVRLTLMPGLGTCCWMSSPSWVIVGVGERGSA